MDAGRPCASSAPPGKLSTLRGIPAASRATAAVNGMKKPTFLLTTRLSRLVRAVRPDRNPLRRPVDRAETAVVGALLVAFLAGAPLIALAVGHWAHRASSLASQAEAAARHRVPAVLLHNAFSPYGAMSNGPLHPRAIAEWAAPDGALRTGTVHAPADALAGSTVMVWIDRAGRLTGVPLTPGDADLNGAMAATAAAIALAGVLAGAGALARHELNRRRLAAWEAAWQVTGPQWTGLR